MKQIKQPKIQPARYGKRWTLEEMEPLRFLAKRLPPYPREWDEEAEDNPESFFQMIADCEDAVDPLNERIRELAENLERSPMGVWCKMCEIRPDWAPEDWHSDSGILIIWPSPPDYALWWSAKGTFANSRAGLERAKRDERRIHESGHKTIRAVK